MKKLQLGSTSFMFMILFLCVLTGNGWTASLLPTTNFNGSFTTSAGIGTGSLSLDTFITKADYVDGTSTNGNIQDVESIIGTTVTLSGAIRTGDYAFNGDPDDPDDVSLSIIDFGDAADPNDDFTYFSASLSNVEFITDGLFYYLNPSLDGEDPSTLNLSNIFLNTDDLHPSRYIDELSVALEGFSVNGMKMTLFIPYGSAGDFTGDSSGYIVEGLIDGIQNPASVPVPEPSTVLLLASGIAGFAGYRKIFNSTN